jgi:hypothetical protein
VVCRVAIHLATTSGDARCALRAERGRCLYRGGCPGELPRAELRLQPP